MGSSLKYLNPEQNWDVLFGVATEILFMHRTEFSFYGNTLKTRLFLLAPRLKEFLILISPLTANPLSIQKMAIYGRYHWGPIRHFSSHLLQKWKIRQNSHLMVKIYHLFPFLRLN